MDLTARKAHPDYIKLNHLQGSELTISAASRKYHIPYETLRRWVTNGLIQEIRRERNTVVINEQDAAFCAQIYQSLPPERRRWIFNSVTGLPRE